MAGVGYIGPGIQNPLLNGPTRKAWLAVLSPKKPMIALFTAETRSRTLSPWAFLRTISAFIIIIIIEFYALAWSWGLLS